MTLWVDGILLGMGAELLLLAVFRRRLAQAMLASLFAGTMLLAAMRLALAGAAWGWVSVSLLLGLAGHVADLRARWR